jgi:hypothetical protein
MFESPMTFNIGTEGVGSTHLWLTWHSTAHHPLSRCVGITNQADNHQRLLPANFFWLAPAAWSLTRHLPPVLSRFPETSRRSLGSWIVPLTPLSIHPSPPPHLRTLHQLTHPGFFTTLLFFSSIVKQQRSFPFVVGSSSYSIITNQQPDQINRFLFFLRSSKV